MRTARFSSTGGGGGVCQPLPDAYLLETDPPMHTPGGRLPWMQTSYWMQIPQMQNPLEAGHVPCDACWEATPPPPPWTEWQTSVKTLSSPKIRLRKVINKKSTQIKIKHNQTDFGKYKLRGTVWICYFAVVTHMNLPLVHAWFLQQ